LSEVLLNDMENMASDREIPWDEFNGKTVIVTGATGLVGSAIVRALYAAKIKYSLSLRVFALGRDGNKAKMLTDNYAAEFIDHDICRPFNFSENVDYIFHCAAITNSQKMVSEPVEVIETSVLGTDNILRLAKEKHIKSMVYLSSMEIYGETDTKLKFINEEALGYIDLKNPRSCYPESKRMCESLCSSWCAQYGVPVKTARLAQTFGAGTSFDDPRVFAQFARSAMAGENIILHTEGKSRGNYCYITDTVRGLLLILFKGNDGEAYNIANPDASMTIREMAEMVADKITGGKVKALFEKPQDIENRGYAKDVTARLSAEKLMELGWKPEFGLEEMYQRMLRDWSERNLRS
jgi:UDP-glucuronate decarboxylase